MKIEKEHIGLLLQQEDIEGLISAGAPIDEYDSEAEYIFLALKELADDEINIENITSVISLIWVKNFDLSQEDLIARQPFLRNVAEKITKTRY